MNTVCGGILKTTQWTKFPETASGSSIIRARLTALAGTALSSRAGLIFSPSQVTLAGITDILPKSGEDIFTGCLLHFTVIRGVIRCGNNQASYLWVFLLFQR